MSWISDLIGGSAGQVIESIGDTVKKFVTTDKDRAEFNLELQKIIAQRNSELETSLQVTLQAKERIIVAEMNQTDNYTKRARPTLVYAGLAMIAINYVVAPWFGLAQFQLPAEFWMAWGGAVSVWSIGRSFEKTGTPNKVAGSKPQKSLFD